MWRGPAPVRLQHYVATHLLCEVYAACHLTVLCVAFVSSASSHGLVTRANPAQPREPRRGADFVLTPAPVPLARVVLAAGLLSNSPSILQAYTEARTTVVLVAQYQRHAHHKSKLGILSPFLMEYSPSPMSLHAAHNC